MRMARRLQRFEALSLTTGEVVSKGQTGENPLT
jgi:hypothetical protein